MMTAKEMKAYRNEKFQDLYNDTKYNDTKYKSLLEYIESKMIDAINKDPSTDMFTFHLPNDITPSVIMYMLEAAGYKCILYHQDDRDISIFI